MQPTARPAAVDCRHRRDSPRITHDAEVELARACCAIHRSPIVGGGAHVGGGGEARGEHKLLRLRQRLILISGCGTKDAVQPAPAAAEHHHHSAAAESGDIQETTASITKLPSFLDKQDPQIAQAYQLVAAHHDLLQYIPCYCGCGSIGHTSNRSCFIKEVKQDGEIVWDDHGTRCTTCLNIAVESSKLEEAGKTPAEIRKIIDGKYKTGYGKPTPTPMPAS